MKKLAKVWNNNKGFIVFIFLLLFFRSAIADWYHIPSGSMQPTLLIGDRVYVDKLAFDVKIPFTDINLNRHAEPQAGDVIVFDSKASGNRLIKRVVGVPGDMVELRNNRLYINHRQVNIELIEYPASFDQFLNDRQIATYYRESFETNQPSTTSHDIRIRTDRFDRSSSFPPIKIPEDSYWVMGDNRDNSADSRVIGFVPRSELIGRAESVVISFDKSNLYMPREGRYSVKL